MKDELLAAPSKWTAIAEIASGIVFIGAIVADGGKSSLSWIGVGLGLFLIVHGARATRMEVRVVGSHLRVVNTYRSVHLPLSDIETVIPDESLPGSLQLVVSGANRPVRIEISSRNRQERESLRQAILEAVRRA